MKVVEITQTPEEIAERDRLNDLFERVDEVRWLFDAGDQRRATALWWSEVRDAVLKDGGDVGPSLVDAYDAVLPRPNLRLVTS